ncbi:MAG: tetratricopeptide repeat protein [Candidatus Delongbacteria bacterium]|jgi:tetratricopeptide (TPR) repeat protein|nr:tetratricopeptide repeat protein [Candidatus Delongbacteria bacterium]MDD4205132.1 tetratricopeptide repeat protein [Candidatus Delongbacteria bacterium]MDY0016869.1 tetratricopeptide repeat protein [Candidatus Delongbacteria bacterium]
MKTFFNFVLASLLIVLCPDLYSKSEIDVTAEILKLRSSGVCYLDPGISPDQAKLFSKYDAINEALNDLGTFLEENDSLINEPAKKNYIVKCLTNRLEVFIYREGEEDIDGYPAYVTHISSDIHRVKLNDLLFAAKTDNKLRYLMDFEYNRFKKLIKNINFLKISTNKLPENFIAELTSGLTATEWANKAHLSNEEGMKIEYYSISVDVDELYESSYIYLAESLVKTGQNSLVMGMLNRLINVDPLNFAAAYSVRGYLFYLEKQYQPAVKELEKSLAIEPSFAYSNCILGAVMADQKKNDEAFQKFAAAIKTDSNYFLPYLYRANLYRKNGKYDEALLDYSEASKINPKNIEPYYNSGIVYYLTGKYEKAVEEYTKALYLDELSPALYYNRAIALRKSSEDEKAAEDYKSYLLLSVKDIDESGTEPLVSSWMSETNFSPIFPD